MNKLITAKEAHKIAYYKTHGKVSKEDLEIVEKEFEKAMDYIDTSASLGFMACDIRVDEYRDNELIAKLLSEKIRNFDKQYDTEVEWSYTEDHGRALYVVIRWVEVNGWDEEEN